MDDNNNIKLSRPVPPFLRYCSAIIPTAFDDSLSYYEALCALYKWLQTNVIDTINHNASVTNDFINKEKELEELFAQLKEYVDTYFDNLDVQEEINNKLDAMVEDGTIEEMVSRIVQTSYLYDEIEVTEYLDEDTNTHYWITHIPHLDKNGELIQIKHGLANDVTDNNLVADEDTRNFACRSGASIAINASVFFKSGDYENHIAGTIIKDGALICNYPIDSTPSTPHSLLGVKADNTLAVYPIGTSYESLIADGVINTFCGFDRVVTGSTITPTFADYHYQWNLIGQNTTTKDIYLFECNGKDFYGEKGMTLPQACQKLVDLGCDFAYRLDQGGSTTLCHNGTMLNVPTDSIGQEVRKVPDFLYFGKTPTSEIDNAFFVGNKERSEASINAQINKAKVTYLNNVESNQLIFNSPSKTSSATGLILSLRKNVGTEEERGDIDLTISPNVEGLEKSINLVDTEQSSPTTILRILPLAKRIRFGANESAPTIANFLTPTEQIAANVDIDGITESGFVFVKYTAGTSPNNRPYTTPFFLLTLKAWETEMFQLALPMAGGFTQGTLKIKARIKTYETWQSWVEI